MKFSLLLLIAATLTSCAGTQFTFGISAQVPTTDGHTADITGSISSPLPAWMSTAPASASAKSAKAVQPLAPLIPAP
jgi:hypothetical protein